MRNKQSSTKNADELILLFQFTKSKNSIGWKDKYVITEGANSVGSIYELADCIC